MNPNTEFELFTQWVYQRLVNNDVLKPTKVQHNVKLKGKSGCEHQIDVYWEYEIAGNLHRVAIECKNYDSLVPIGKVRDFQGVLADLNNVNGIMVSRKGYQEGAKKYADQYGISLKELRSPNYGETVIGKIDIVTHVDLRRTLFLVDEDWALEKGINMERYRQRLNAIRFPNNEEWTKTSHIPLQTDEDIIRDFKGEQISSLKELEEQLHEEELNCAPVTFSFENAYIAVHGVGPVKIKEVRYEYKIKDEVRSIAIDAGAFVMAILKDAQSNETNYVILQ